MDNSSQEHYDNFIEFLYLNFIKFIQITIQSSTPYIRRFLRFLALPYCYFKLINWDECSSSRWQVCKDLLYIFFKLKYFPDNYSLCRLWEKERSEWAYYYGSIYDPYQRGRLRKDVQPKEYEIIFQDKYICYELCKAAGLPLPIQYAQICPDDDYRSLIDNIFKQNENVRLIIKPTLGRGGRGIVIAFKRKYDIIIRTANDELLLIDFKLDSRAVVQKYISQHRDLDKISSSINTVRIVTLLTKEKDVLVVGAMMRFGVGNAFVDNRCMGGMAAGIDINRGVLKKNAYDFQHKVYQYHPTSRIYFEETQIPLWNEVVSLAKKIQLTFPFFKLLGHDIAITPNGPVILEINDAHDNVGLEQAYGPILLDKTIRNAFIKYDLLINKPSRNL